jgi:hypothetical protein
MAPKLTGLLELVMGRQFGSDSNHHRLTDVPGTLGRKVAS